VLGCSCVQVEISGLAPLRLKIFHRKDAKAQGINLTLVHPFRNSQLLLSLPPGKPARPAPAELPQDRKVARVGGCSGAMFGLPFLFFSPIFSSEKFFRSLDCLATNFASGHFILTFTTPKKSLKNHKYEVLH